MTRRKRRGMTLLEVIVIVTALLVIATAAGVMLASALRSSNDATSGLMRHRALAQLDRQMRRDVRAASGAKVEEEQLTLTKDAKSIVYEQQGSGVERRESDADGKLLRREQFRFDAPVTVHWKVSDAAAQTVTLSFEPLPHRSEVSEGWRGMQTTAIVGSDRRFNAKGAP
jgi:type II secretory pathway pseudopilin PulG